MTSCNRQTVAHEWTRANDTDHGKTSTGNLFYRGKTIYSYGQHFPIARWGIVTTDNPLQTDDYGTEHTRVNHVVLYDGQRYSSTTSGHQCAVRRAIPGHWYVFDVPHVDFDWANQSAHDCAVDIERNNFHQANWQSIVDAHRSELEKSVRARTMKASHLSNAETLRLRANQYRSLFNLDVANVPENPDIQASIAIAQAQRAEYEHKNEERRIAEQSAKLQRWLDGVNSPTPYFDGPVRLRISHDGKNIETSKGASFPIRHALRAYPTLLDYRNAGFVGVCELSPAITAHRLGNYVIESVDENGVQAGCHVVSWAEIERIYPLAIAARDANRFDNDDYPEVSAVGSTASLHN